MPKGVTVRSPERVAEAIRLRERGLKLREIADHFDVSLKTVHSWVSDPDLTKYRTRRSRYAVTCVDCGTTIANGSKDADPEEPVCRSCAGAHYAIWTKDAIVFAIQEWADEHGGVPPTATQWSSRADRRWPYPNTLIYHFGSWNAAIAAAGFEPRPVGMYGRPGEDPAEIERTVHLYRSGLTAAEVGDVLGVAGATVLQRLEAAGEPRRARWDYRRDAA